MKQHLDEFSINYAVTYYVFHYHICKDTTAIITLITTQLSTWRHEPIGCTTGKWNIYIFQIMTSHLLGANWTLNLILMYCHLELLTTQLKFWFTKYTLFFTKMYLETLSGEFQQVCSSVEYQYRATRCIKRPYISHIEGILPKGPYLPCVSMAGRALLARYHRYLVWLSSNTQWLLWPEITHWGIMGTFHPAPISQRFLAATKQLYDWFSPSVCLSVRPSVCHTFFTMFPSSYHHEIFRSYYHGQKWCPYKRSRSEVKGQGHRGKHPT